MQTNRKVIVTVTNDLTHDQRVRKVCESLMKIGITPYLVGRKLSTSVPIDRVYPTKRFKLLFNKGVLFYAEYNIRLFFFLLTKRYASIHANDLDTLLGCYLASRFRGKSLVYDSHEYFTEVPELQDNPFAKRTWERIEELIFPKLNHTITVNDSIALLFEKKYNKRPAVMRNIPEQRENSAVSMRMKSRSELGLPMDKKILIIQGTGINVDRGNEEMVECISYLENYLLLIIGSGDVLPQLKQKVHNEGLAEKVLFMDKMPYEELCQYTLASDAGISVDKDTNINYRYSLPNKLFDFIHAGIPSIVSNLPEVKKIVEGYKVGAILTSHNPKEMALEIKEYFTELDFDSGKQEELKVHLSKAAKELKWENEAKILEKIYS